ncbi:septal ring lytic transglycosylase RlpA family protein [Flavobacterium arcticum]|uniref:Probable endolytic peptidoglycan transglycosylase RlpA n=1 Tax=Flavobacterium arcticum TaxID=1784713 RepID=A0A345HBN0_9FLAO|nr:septal ring lytic transglycosylase RlpA family protein [Flavobacterium arcticum]AXG73990.1 septal ring lytic transglycosylase RlpA family protein [Flavobacterium arcticum]KAF2508968.1 septal ring lytic transglycosylase RlpA family protein [Flavobacterium arcticum]
MAKRILLLFITVVLLTACSSSKKGSSASFKSYDKKAVASYYANKYNGRKTASGEKFSNSKYTAAHKKLPFGTKVRVTNKANGKSVIVKINDRGPFTRGRDIDLSKKAWMAITHDKKRGLLDVTIEVAK